MQLSGYEVFILTLREIEESHPIHRELLNWARWGMQDAQIGVGVVPPSVWELPGKPDPDRDTDTPPEPAQVPVNEKRANELDARICDPDFPAIWRRVLAVHYLPPKSWCAHVIPEWQRPGAAKVSQETYMEQFRSALEALG